MLRSKIGLWGLIVIAVIISACVSAPTIDKEKAGYLAGIRFLETHPGEVASYSVKDPGGDAYVVFFNTTTSSDDVRIDFAEYFVDKYTKDVYVSSKYANALSIEKSSNINALFKRYPSAKYTANLLETGEGENIKRIWEIRVIANSVDVAVFAFDADEELVLGENFAAIQSFSF